MQSNFEKIKRRPKSRDYDDMKAALASRTTREQRRTRREAKRSQGSEGDVWQ